jgi:microcompartment protein CcmK/EutM
MILARIVGTVVATRKDERLVSNKLLLARPMKDCPIDAAIVGIVDTVTVKE